MLGEVGELESPIGQLICTAAVVDDVLSLLLLAEVQALGEDDPKVSCAALVPLRTRLIRGCLASVLNDGTKSPKRLRFIKRKKKK